MEDRKLKSVNVELTSMDINVITSALHGESQRIGLTDGGKSQMMIIQTLNKFSDAVEIIKNAELDANKEADKKEDSPSD